MQGTNVYSRLYSCLFSYIWQDLTSDPEVLETVTGQKIELGTWSKQLKLLGKPKFSEVQSESIDLEIAQLLQKGVIQPCHHEAGGFISPVFTRPKKDSSFRMILNLIPMSLIIILKWKLLDCHQNDETWMLHGIHRSERCPLFSPNKQ